MRDLDKEAKIYNEGFKKGQSHMQSAPETRERLSVLEINLKLSMEQNTKEHLEIKEAINEIKQTLKCALEGKANRWVEQVMIWVGIAIGGGIITFITWYISTGMLLRF